MKRTLKTALIAAPLLALAACGGGSETTDGEAAVEGAAEDSMKAAEGAGDAMSEGVDAMQEGASDAMKEGGAAADQAFESAEEGYDELSDEEAKAIADAESEAGE